MESKNVRLTYFNLNGLAAIPRMLLNHGNIKFEDRRLSSEEWAKVKETLNFKFLPCLEIDGVQYCESLAINFYLARKIGNLLGKTPEDEYCILSALTTWSDFGSKIVARAFNKGDQKENTEALLTGIKKIAGGLENIYSRNGSGTYFLGDTMSLADFYLVYVFGYKLMSEKNFSDATEEFKNNAPKLYKAIEGLYKSDTFVKLFEKSLIKDASI